MGESVSSKGQPAFCWVQCDRCELWRNLPGCTKKEYEEIQRSRLWTCDMNRWDASQALCFKKNNNFQPSVKQTTQVCHPSSRNTAPSSLVSYWKSKRSSEKMNLRHTTKFVKDKNERSAIVQYRATSRSRSQLRLKTASKSREGLTNEKEIQAKKRKPKYEKDTKKRYHGVHSTEENSSEFDISVDKALKKNSSGLGNKEHDVAQYNKLHVSQEDDRGSVRWAQCDICQKWRSLPGCTEMDYIELHQSDAPWRCSFNRWDVLRADCSAPEEELNRLGDELSEMELREFDNYVDQQLPAKVPLKGFPWHLLPLKILKLIFLDKSTSSPACCEDSFVVSQQFLFQCYDLLVNFFLEKNSLLVTCLKRIALFCLKNFFSFTPQKDLNDETASTLQDGLYGLVNQEEELCKALHFFTLLPNGVASNTSTEKDEQEQENLQEMFLSLVENRLPSSKAIFEFIRLFRPMLDFPLHDGTDATQKSSFVSYLMTINRRDLIELLKESSFLQLDPLSLQLRNIPVVLFKTCLPKYSQHPLYGRTILKSDEPYVQISTLFPNFVSICCKDSAALETHGKRLSVASTGFYEKANSNKTCETDKQFIQLDVPFRRRWPTSASRRAEEFLDISSLPYASHEMLEFLQNHVSSPSDRCLSDDSVTVSTPSHSQPFHKIWTPHKKKSSVYSLQKKLEKYSVQLCHDFKACSSYCCVKEGSVSKSFEKTTFLEHMEQKSAFNKVRSTNNWFQEDLIVKTPISSSTLQEIEEDEIAEETLSGKSYEPRDKGNVKNTGAWKNMKPLSPLMKQDKKKKQKKESVNNLVTFSTLNKLLEADSLLDVCVLLVLLRKFLLFTNWGFQFFNTLVYSKETCNEPEYFL